VGRVRTKARLLDAIARAADFPSDFGGNWDALNDSLQDLSWRPAAGYVLHVNGGGSAKAALGDDWAIFIEILRHAAAYWAGRGKYLIALIDDAALPDWT
jgi:hypothetical protein